jgi:anti-anti-sigma factor
LGSLELIEVQRGEVRILTLLGVLEARAARDLGKRLLGSPADGRRCVLLDLSRLESIAGEGLRAIMATAARLQAAGGALALCCPQSQVRRVLEMAGLERTLTLHAERQAACDWLVETVRREQVARLAARLLRRDERAPQGFRAAKADTARATLAARLLLQAAAAPEPEQRE